MFWRTLILAFLAVGARAAVRRRHNGEYVQVINLEYIFEHYRNTIKRAVTYECTKAGGDDVEDKAEQLLKSAESFIHCIIPLYDFETLDSEVEAYLEGPKDNGTLNDFKKYCAKAPKLKTCLYTLIDSASPCMKSPESERPLAKNRIDQFLDYVCYNDGYKITQFVSENGIECFFSKDKEMFEVNMCIQPLLDRPVEKFLALSLKERCSIIDTVINCFLKSFKTCTPPTPGYLLEDLVTYARKGSVCNDALPLPGSDSDRRVPESTWPMATRTTWPAATTTTLPTATRTTALPAATGTTALPAATGTIWPAANTTTLPTILLKLYVTVKVEFPNTNSTVTTVWKN